MECIKYLREHVIVYHPSTIHTNVTLLVCTRTCAYLKSITIDTNVTLFVQERILALLINNFVFMNSLHDCCSPLTDCQFDEGWADNWGAL